MRLGKLIFTTTVLALSACSSSGNDKHDNPPNDANATPSDHFEIGQPFQFQGKSSAGNALWAAPTGTFGLAVAAPLSLQSDATLAIAGTDVTVSGCMSDVDLKYAISKDDGSVKLSTQTREQHQLIEENKFPGTLKAGIYTVTVLAVTSDACEVSGSIVLATTGAPKNNTPTPSPSPSPIGPGPTPTPAPTPPPSAGFEGTWNLQAPYREYRGDGWYKIYETFTVTDARMRFSRQSQLDGTEALTQEELYEADVALDSSTTPLRSNELVTKLYNGGLSGIYEGGHRYCIYRFQTGLLQMHCSTFSFPTDFFSNSYWYSKSN